MFQHTAARRRLDEGLSIATEGILFQHTAARRRLDKASYEKWRADLFQHTAARRRLVIQCSQTFLTEIVSTHSRPKAAGSVRCPPMRIQNRFQHTAARRRLGEKITCPVFKRRFQHTAARRRLGSFKRFGRWYFTVSTHSRPKAAGKRMMRGLQMSVSFNTQPPEGGWPYLRTLSSICTSFNTQPPEGGWKGFGNYPKQHFCFNTQPPEGGWPSESKYFVPSGIVSTHSRPKAAGTETRDGGQT